MRRSYPISYWKVRTSRRIKSHWTQTETHRLSPSSNTSRYIYIFLQSKSVYFATRNARRHHLAASAADRRRCAKYILLTLKVENIIIIRWWRRKPNNRIPSVLCYSHNVAKKSFLFNPIFYGFEESGKDEIFSTEYIYHDFVKCVVVSGDFFLQIHRYWYSAVSSLFWLKSPYSSEGD